MSTSWEQALVDAQVEINRAVFEMNRDGGVPPAKPDLAYIREKVRAAIEDLQDCAARIPGAQMKLRMTDVQVDADDAAEGK